MTETEIAKKKCPECGKARGHKVDCPTLHEPEPVVDETADDDAEEETRRHPWIRNDGEMTLECAFCLADKGHEIHELPHDLTEEEAIAEMRAAGALVEPHAFHDGSGEDECSTCGEGRDAAAHVDTVTVDGTEARIVHEEHLLTPPISLAEALRQFDAAKDRLEQKNRALAEAKGFVKDAEAWMKRCGDTVLDAARREIEPELPLGAS